MELYFRVLVSMCEWAYDETKENAIISAVADTFKEAWEIAIEDNKKYDGVNIELTDGENVIASWSVGYLGNNNHSMLVPIEDNYSGE